MTFINETKTILRKSDNSLVVFNLDNNLEYENIDSYLNKVAIRKISDGEFSFINTWFDIDKDDNIYGIINDSKGRLINLDIKEDQTESSTLVKYDYKNFIMKFPYIKEVDDVKHIFYYSLNKKTNCISYLIHIYKKDNISIKTKIDIVKYNIMSNFVVTWNGNIPSLFYFNKVNGFEEIFASTYDLDNLKWSSPTQLTNSKKIKIYLSAIRHVDNSYHIVYSENHNGKYFCEYLKLNINNNVFDILESNTIANNLMCLFPCIIGYYSILYIQWVEYNDLFTCKSTNLGKTWSEPIKDNEISDYPFIRYEYKSNNNLDTVYNLTSVFANNNSYDVNHILPR
ncbi:MAG: hypothetical protein ACRC92_17200 [Peptostreptococcaceae bacterium]